jgi:hypothetical protein
MRDRAVTLGDLNQLRLWIESRPEVPEGDWYKDFGSFNFAAAGLFRRHSCFPDRPPKARPSEDQKAKNFMGV